MRHYIPPALCLCSNTLHGSYIRHGSYTIPPHRLRFHRLIRYSLCPIVHLSHSKRKYDSFHPLQSQFRYNRTVPDHSEHTNYQRHSCQIRYKKNLLCNHLHTTSCHMPVLPFYWQHHSPCSFACSTSCRHSAEPDRPMSVDQHHWAVPFQLRLHQLPALRFPVVFPLSLLRPPVLLLQPLRAMVHRPA